MIEEIPKETKMEEKCYNSKTYGRRDRQRRNYYRRKIEEPNE